MAEAIEKRAPMASAPMKYREGGEVAWGEVWDTFCALAQEGGPPHRETMLHAQEDSDVESGAYRFVVAEIVRGVREVSGLEASAGAPGWIRIQCHSHSHARWLCEAILQENVDAQAEGSTLLVPAGEDFTIKGEIKNVITAVAKTTHYWMDHLPAEVKQTLAWQVQMEGLREKLFGWLKRREKQKAESRKQN